MLGLGWEGCSALSIYVLYAYGSVFQILWMDFIVHLSFQSLDMCLDKPI